MFTTENRKNEYVVRITTSMLIVEITGTLNIWHHKIRFLLRVLHRVRDSAKWLHLDIVYLSPTSAYVFREKLPWFGASMKTPSGVPSGRNSTYASIYRKYKPCLLCSMFGACSSSGTDHNISRKEFVTIVDAWGSYGARERCLWWWYRGMRRNTYSCTSRESEALLDHLDQLGATVQSYLRRRPRSKFPFTSHRL